MDIVDWKAARETIQRVNLDTAGRTYPHPCVTTEAMSIRQLKHPEIQNDGERLDDAGVVHMEVTEYILRGAHMVVHGGHLYLFGGGSSSRRKWSASSSSNGGRSSRGWRAGRVAGD
jgi:hypothetical protein